MAQSPSDLRKKSLRVTTNEVFPLKISAIAIGPYRFLNEQQRCTETHWDEIVLDPNVDRGNNVLEEPGIHKEERYN